MLLRAFVLVTACLLVAVDNANDEETKAEMKRLQGTWIMIKKEEKGKKVAHKSLAWVIEGNKITMTRDGKLLPGSQGGWTFSVDINAKPTTMTLVASGGPSKGMKTVSIYTLGLNELTVCLPLDPTEKPPKEFTSKQQPECQLLEFQRERK